jgi:hypothetical protein
MKELSIKSACFAHESSGLVKLVLSDNTETSIYLNDGSPKSICHDMLEKWMNSGNAIETTCN